MDKRYQVQLSVRIQAVTEGGSWLSENLELSETIKVRDGAGIVELLAILGKIHGFAVDLKEQQQ